MDVFNHLALLTNSWHILPRFFQLSSKFSSSGIQKHGLWELFVPIPKAQTPRFLKLFPIIWSKFTDFHYTPSTCVAAFSCLYTKSISHILKHYVVCWYSIILPVLIAFLYKLIKSCNTLRSFGVASAIVDERLKTYCGYLPHIVNITDIF
jgi:hypothetical protein